MDDLYQAIGVAAGQYRAIGFEGDGAVSAPGGLVGAAQRDVPIARDRAAAATDRDDAGPGGATTFIWPEMAEENPIVALPW
ncbi:hypothetical protein [Mycetocola sp. JXN-3]|uniref:hypothetical protein n=1 Tax=Mycetocola sp. JXN-3 TaxID=2116510 RepID=UPI00165D1BF0|nr:hypothetical protein [Mycetocola sp. JXN-3]